MTEAIERNKRRRQRVRSPHPGVVLIRPDASGRHAYWRARFQDPDRRKMVKVKLDRLALPTGEARRDWAIRKATELARRRMELEHGAPRETGVALSATIERYFQAHPHLRSRTSADYRAAAAKLLRWAASEGIVNADALTRPALMGFRETIVSELKRVPVRGQGQRGKRREVAERRSEQTINSELRRVRTILSYLIELELMVRLSHDDLRRALKYLQVTHERVQYLRPAELRQLLAAASRHDAEVFSATRLEHAGHGAPGRTPRYDPIAPFVVTVLLTGMRFGEALGLQWQQVDLDVRDTSGTAVGAIELEGKATKTHKARTIGLEVSPALRLLLVHLRLARGDQRNVFSLTADTAQAAAKRLRRLYGAPERFTWQMLRRTCGTFLTNAPGIFGAASAYRSAKQLGHSVAIAERHYLGVERGIPREAQTLEAAMQIESAVSAVLRGDGSACTSGELARIDRAGGR